ncbi:MAG: hypothetical protein QXY61_01690 [Candidatus Anstonellales archaeon]
MFVFQVQEKMPFAEQKKGYSYNRNSSAKPLLRKRSIGEILNDVKGGKLPEHYDISREDAKRELVKLGLSEDLAEYWLEGMKRVVGEDGGYAFWAVQFATNLWYDSKKGQRDWWNDKFVCYFDDVFSEEEISKLFPGKPHNPKNAGVKNLREDLHKFYLGAIRETATAGLTPEERKQLAEEGSVIVKRADEGPRLVYDKGELTTIVIPDETSESGEKIITLEEANLEDLGKAYNAAMRFCKLAQEADRTNMTQPVDPQIIRDWNNASDSARREAAAAAGTTPPLIDEWVGDGEISPEEAREWKEMMPDKSFDKTIKLLEKRRDEVYKKLEELRWRMLLTQSASDLEQIRTNYDTTNPKGATQSAERKDLATIAMIVEKQEEYWKKRFSDLKSAFEYAKSRKPPALKRFMRELSDSVNEIDGMAKRLELIDRIAGYGINIILFSKNKDIGEFFTRTDLLNVGYKLEQFSNLVKAETKEVLRLNQNVTPTLVFFGIFKFENGKLGLSDKGEKYLKEWCKKNNYDFNKIKGEILLEFSIGILSSVGQSFLAYAVKRAMEENGITPEDEKTFKSVQIRAKAVRVELSERAKELNKRIEELGGKKLAVGDSTYEKNYDLTINRLSSIIGSA